MESLEEVGLTVEETPVGEIRRGHTQCTRQRDACLAFQPAPNFSPTFLPFPSALRAGLSAEHLRDTLGVLRVTDCMFTDKYNIYFFFGWVDCTATLEVDSTHHQPQITTKTYCHFDLYLAINSYS